MALNVLSPTAILGYGFPRENIERAIRHGVDVIGVDAGSTDPGPYYLGSGKSFTSPSMVERDLTLLLGLHAETGAPIVVTSAGGGGARPHVDWALERLASAASKTGSRLRVAVLYTDVDPGEAARLAREGLLEPVEKASPRLVEDWILSSRIVAQVGLEPIIHVLDEWKPDVVIAGRAVDAVAFASYPIYKGYRLGPSLHMGKILECGALAAEPGSGSDSMMAVLDGDGFTVFPVNPERRATIVSVAEHSLYERADPYREYVPGGYVDLSNVKYWQVDERSVRAEGARWVPLGRYLVKLEGSRPVGYRYVAIAGARDPLFIGSLPDAVREAERRVREYLGGGVDLRVRLYGWNAVLGDAEWMGPGHEVALLIEAVSMDEQRASDAVALARAVLLHYGFPGRKTTAGNLAFPLSPSDLYAGMAYAWSLWHFYEPPDRLWPVDRVLVHVDSQGVEVLERA